MAVAGERLTTSWEVILRLLEAVPTAKDATTVSLAFQCVHLVAADLMPALPANLLRSSLEVVSLYAAQEVKPFSSELTSQTTALPSTLHSNRYSWSCKGLRAGSGIKGYYNVARQPLWPYVSGNNLLSAGKSLSTL